MNAELTADVATDTIADVAADTNRERVPSFASASLSFLVFPTATNGNARKRRDYVILGIIFSIGIGCTSIRAHLANTFSISFFVREFPAARCANAQHGIL